MSEPSSSVPDEIADAQVEESQSGADEVEKVELEVDEEKLEAWDDIKGDYQVEPDGQAVPNSMDSDTLSTEEDQEDESAADTSSEDNT
jgi:hypothetical protein